MNRTVPRWEWRTFGDLGAAEERILARGDRNATSSVETYVVSRDSTTSTRIADGLLHISKLDAIDSGLERWHPVLDSPFPLTAGVLGPVIAAWNVAPPPLDRATYSLEQFVGEIVRTHGHLTAVTVEKKVYGAAVGGCIVEFARVWFDGTPAQSAAVEGEDPLAVLQTVRGLGLDGFENINYVRALKRLHGILAN